MLNRTKIDVEKLKEVYINTNSVEYKRYRSMITLKFVAPPRFLGVSIGSWIIYFTSHSSGTDIIAICFLVLAIGCYYKGYRLGKNYKFNFHNMVKNDFKDMSEEKQKKILRERQKRISIAIIEVRSFIWLATFFIIDSIADNIREELNLHSIFDYSFAFLILLMFSVFLPLIASILYVISPILMKLKNILFYYAHHGMFTTSYVILTIIEKNLLHRSH